MERKISTAEMKIKNKEEAFNENVVRVRTVQSCIEVVCDLCCMDRLRYGGFHFPSIAIE